MHLGRTDRSVNLVAVYVYNLDIDYSVLHFKNKSIIVFILNTSVE